MRRVAAAAAADVVSVYAEMSGAYTRVEPGQTDRQTDSGGVRQAAVSVRLSLLGEC